MYLYVCLRSQSAVDTGESDTVAAVVDLPQRHQHPALISLHPRITPEVVFHRLYAHLSFRFITITVKWHGILEISLILSDVDSFKRRFVVLKMMLSWDMILLNMTHWRYVCDVVRTCHEISSNETDTPSCQTLVQPYRSLSHLQIRLYLSKNKGVSSEEKSTLQSKLIEPNKASIWRGLIIP